jgi:hypothetical protein
MSAIAPQPAHGAGPSASPTSRTGARSLPLHRVAAALAGLNAVLYGLISAGVTSVGRADEGELGILGAAGVVYLALAAVLWFVPRPLVWAAATVMQVLVIAMYVAIAPERDPSFEVWGVTLRVLQVAMIVALVTLLVRAVRGRTRSR